MKISRIALLGLLFWSIAEWTGMAQFFPPNEPVAQRRAAAMKRYDVDGDGRLNGTERETLRKARFNEALQSERSGRRRGGFPMPPEVVKKYDKDGDGQLNDDESRAAFDGIRKQWEELRKKYDKDASGELEPEEMDLLAADVQAGKIEGMPRMFMPFGRQPRMTERERIVKGMDKDGDGRLNADELAAVRAELERKKGQP